MLTHPADSGDSGDTRPTTKSTALVLQETCAYVGVEKHVTSYLFIN